MSQTYSPCCGAMKSLSNPTQDQDNPSVSVFQGKIVRSPQIHSHCRVHPASPVKSSFIKLYESVWSREAVKWLWLSASSSSHKCLCLVCVSKKGGWLSFVGILPIDTGHTWPTVCVQWSLIGEARAGLRCNNGKPTFQKALGCSW